MNIHFDSGNASAGSRVLLKRMASALGAGWNLVLKMQACCVQAIMELTAMQVNLEVPEDLALLLGEDSAG